MEQSVDLNVAKCWYNCHITLTSPLSHKNSDPNIGQTQKWLKVSQDVWRGEGGRGVQRVGIPNIFLTSTFLDILGTVNHVTEVLCVRVGV